MSDSYVSDIKNYLVWKLFALYNLWCRWRLFNAFPGIEREIADYSRGSKTTGTKFSTLWRAVRIILKEKPSLNLECGTGLSTIVLAAAARQLKGQISAHQAMVIGMEIVGKWGRGSKSNLRGKYSDVVDLFLGSQASTSSYVGAKAGCMHLLPTT